MRKITLIIAVTAVFAVLAILTALSASAAPHTHGRAIAKASPSKYRAACGMIYTTAEAKKYGYVCPMDHSKLVPIR